MNFEVWMDQKHIGTMDVETLPGFQQPSTTFSYLSSWISETDGFEISPDLPLQRGPQTPAPHRTTFLAFDDAAPDRWGRRLLDARARKIATDTKTPLVWPTEIDRLLAVDDESRQGALRFRQDGSFLSSDETKATTRDLPVLARAAQRFLDSGEIDEEIEELIGVGSSPGGAQPKAWVRDDNGDLLLAKFPRTSDMVDASAWELTAMRLQERAGIQVQESSGIRLGHERSVFLTRRFDRREGARIPYMSFKNAFSIPDFNNPDYATLARKVAHISASPDEDAAELFSRAAISAMINNIDDHMRNHGLLRSAAGWRLSPSFDVNPERSGRSDTPLTPEDDPGNRDIRLLIEAADDFRLTHAEAVQRVRIIDDAVSHWQEDATACGVGPDDISYMESAFEGPNRERASELSSINQTIIDLGSSTSSSGDIWVPTHIRDGKKVEGHLRRRPR